MSNPQEESKPSAGLLQAAKALDLNQSGGPFMIPAHEVIALHQAIAAEAERGAEDSDRRWYQPDGSYTVMDSADAVVARRKWAAGRMEELEVERDALQMISDGVPALRTERDQLRKELEAAKDSCAVKDSLLRAGESAMDQTNDELVGLRKELEAATKERDFLVSEYERAVKCEPRGFAHAAGHIYNAVVNAKCDVNAQRFIDLMERAEKAEAELETAKAASASAIRHFEVKNGELRDRAEKAEASGDAKLKRLRDDVQADYDRHDKIDTTSSTQATRSAIDGRVGALRGVIDKLDRLLAEPPTEPEPECECDRSVGENCPDCYAPAFDKPEPAAERGEDGPLREFLTIVDGEDDPGVQRIVIALAELCRRELARGGQAK